MDFVLRLYIKQPHISNSHSQLENFFVRFHTDSLATSISLSIVSFLSCPPFLEKDHTVAIMKIITKLLHSEVNQDHLFLINYLEANSKHEQKAQKDILLQEGINKWSII